MAIEVRVMSNNGVTGNAQGRIKVNETGLSKGNVELASSCDYDGKVYARRYSKDYREVISEQCLLDDDGNLVLGNLIKGNSYGFVPNRRKCEVNYVGVNINLVDGNISSNGTAISIRSNGGNCLVTDILLIAEQNSILNDINVR
jgi:hypothetical protein